jgi:hypothetical protein
MTAVMEAGNCYQQLTWINISLPVEFFIHVFMKYYTACRVGSGDNPSAQAEKESDEYGKCFF